MQQINLEIHEYIIIRNTKDSGTMYNVSTSIYILNLLYMNLFRIPTIVNHIVRTQFDCKGYPNWFHTYTPIWHKESPHPYSIVIIYLYARKGEVRRYSLVPIYVYNSTKLYNKNRIEYWSQAVLEKRIWKVKNKKKTADILRVLFTIF